MPENEVIERIARVLCQQADCDPDALEPGDVFGVDGHRHGEPGHFMWREFVKDVRAIIEAMREEDLEALLAERKFDRLVVASGDCRLWAGAVDRRDGYGRFYVGGKTVGAHQFAYRRMYGDVPEGMVIDHVCRNRRCVNPDHLRTVTRVENVMIGSGVTAENARKELCTHGHPLSGENLYVKPNGERGCRQCRLEASRRYKARRREAAAALSPSNQEADK